MDTLEKFIEYFIALMSSSPIEFVFYAALIIVMFIIFFISLFRIILLGRKVILLSNLSRFLNGKISPCFFIIPGFKGQHEGFPYKIELWNSGRHNSSRDCLGIFFERRTPFNMTIHTRGESSLADVKTGNPDFDNRFVVYSSDVWPVSNYLKTPDVQEHISALFLLDYTELQITKNRVQVEKLSSDVKVLAVDLERTRLTKTIKSLAFLAKSLS